MLGLNLFVDTLFRLSSMRLEGISILHNLEHIDLQIVVVR